VYTEPSWVFTMNNWLETRTISSPPKTLFEKEELLRLAKLDSAAFASSVLPGRTARQLFRAGWGFTWEPEHIAGPGLRHTTLNTICLLCIDAFVFGQVC
jgi:hypothetical protein